MNTTITENNENVREVNVDKLLEEVLAYEKGESPKSAFEMADVYDFPIKKLGPTNNFSQKPKRTGPPAKAFGKLPNFTKKGGRKISNNSRSNRKSRLRSRRRRQMRKRA